MKKFVNIGLLLLVLVLLSACGTKDIADAGASAEAAPESSVEGDSGVKLEGQPRSESGDNSLPLATELLLGTFHLEDSEFAVDVELALDLVPYWKLYKTLLESDTTAPEELDALVAGIQDVMTADQLDYIASLELIQEDLMTFANESGILDKLRPEGAESGDGTGQDKPEGIGSAGGGQGRGFGNTDENNPEMVATLQARKDEMSGTGGIANRLQIPMIEALIDLLEGKLELE